MYVQGSFEADTFSYIELAVLGCGLLDGQCKDIEAADNLPVSIITLKSHVDFADKNFKEDPISYSFDTTNYLIVNTKVVQKMNLYYAKAKVILDDYALKKYLPPPEVPIFEFNSRYQY